MKKPPQTRKKIRESGNSTTIFDLSDDLLTEILVRLPIKSACQCKSISKHWRALTSSPSFVCSFCRATIDGTTSSSSPLTPAVLPLPFTVVSESPDWLSQWWEYLVVEHKAETRIPSSSANTMFGSRGFSLSFLPCYLEDIQGFRVVGSSNGLLLCRAEKYDPFDLVYYVCNPFKEVWFQLPHPPPPADQETDEYYVHGDCLLGFMCDPYYNDRYRVVRAESVSTFLGMSSLHIDVFSSETGDWRQLILSCPLYLQLSTNYCNGVVCNGRLHWISGRHGLFAFDPFKETANSSNDRLSFIDLPPDLKGLDSIYFINVHLGVCRGRLRILYLFTPPGEEDNDDNNIVLPPMPILKVWELEDCSAGKWRVLHDKRIDISSDDTSRGLRREWASPFSMSVAFHPYEEDVVYIWFRSKLVSCNLNHSKFEVIESNKHLENNGSMKLLLAQPWCHTPVNCPPHAKSTHQDNVESGTRTLERN